MADADDGHENTAGRPVKQPLPRRKYRSPPHKELQNEITPNTFGKQRTPQATTGALRQTPKQFLKRPDQC
ncbi:MAG: hypothetical protein ABF705_10115, partial [Acetobacter syzygii]